MINRLRYELIVNGRPALAGMLQGLAGIAFISLLIGLVPFTASGALPLLAWCALAYGRPAAWRIALLLTLACGTDLLSGAAVGRSIPPLAAAMLAASFVTGVGNEERWRAGHALYTAVAIPGWYLGTSVFAFVKPTSFGPVPSIATAFISFLVFSVACAAISIPRAVRVLRSPDSHRVSLAGVAAR